ncbi:MAG: hypothetical protein ACK56I_07445, partial [bacterium]
MQRKGRVLIGRKRRTLDCRLERVGTARQIDPAGLWQGGGKTIRIGEGDLHIRVALRDQDRAAPVARDGGRVVGEYVAPEA